MKIELPQLKEMLKSNVCEVSFTRRRKLDKRPDIRYMICTNDPQILMSPNGRICLNFRPTNLKLPYNPDEKGLIVTWDVFMQDYRQIPMPCNLISATPREKFWDFFNSKLAHMSAQEKIKYMDR